MADNKPTEKIVLCKMFTGNYWENENNLGHETINMFLPDGEEEKKVEDRRSYIYLPASGDYDLKQHKITKVLLVRSIPGKKGETVQIIGKADVVDGTGELLSEIVKEPCLSGGKEFVGLFNIFKVFNGEPPYTTVKKSITQEDVRASLKKIAAEYQLGNPAAPREFFMLAVRLGFQKQSKETMTGKALMKSIPSLQSSGKTLRSKTKQEIYDEVKKNEKYFTNIVDKEDQGEYNFWYAVIKGAVQEPENDKHKMSAETFYELVTRKYKKALELYNIFQSKTQKDVRETVYAKHAYNEIFANNENFGVLNICATFQVKNLQIAAENFYLTTNPNENGVEYIQIEKKDIKKSKQEQEEDDSEKYGKLSATSQKVYLSENVKLANSDIMLWSYLNDEAQKHFWKDASPLVIDYNNPYIKDSFLTVIKQEYDELVYSNLFAYFFSKNPLFFNYFFENIEWEDVDGNARGKVFDVWQSDKAEVDTALSVEREKKNIDLFIKTNKKIIVIENKIKSGINGKEDNCSDSDMQTQLEKYYEHATQIAQKENLNSCFLIFAPNYNILDKNDFKSAQAQAYKIVRYKKIFDVCQNFKKEGGYNSFTGIDKLYYEEFLKALNIHTDSSANNYYRQMQKRLMRIKNEQGEK